jgi:hypothetical protein
MTEILSSVMKRKEERKVYIIAEAGFAK